MLKSLLVHFSIPLRNSDNPSPAIHAGMILEALTRGCNIPVLHQEPVYKSLKDNLYSPNEIERGRALTNLVDERKITREKLW